MRRVDKHTVGYRSCGFGRKMKGEEKYLEGTHEIRNGKRKNLWQGNKAPNSNKQAPEKLQIPSTKGGETIYPPDPRFKFRQGRSPFLATSIECCLIAPLQRRMSMRRFTRITNAFSRKVENHEAAVALHFMYYNFGRFHPTLRVTPTMEAGISDHVWTLQEIVGLLP